MELNFWKSVVKRLQGDGLASFFHLQGWIMIQLVGGWETAIGEQGGTI